MNASNKLCVAKDLKIHRLKGACKNYEGEKPVMLADFEPEIGQDGLKQIRKIPDGMKNDSTFIITLVRPAA